MRPHDPVILCAVVLQTDESWFMKDLAVQLHLSHSEISESLHRSMQVGLINPDKRQIQKLNLCDFIQHGLKYVFPAIPGTLERGVPTAASAKPLRDKIRSSIDVVWPVPGGEISGISIAPLYKKLPEACMKWNELYRVVSLIDAIRMNQSAREVEIAVQLLKKLLIDESGNK